MKNLFISNNYKKNEDEFVSDVGLLLRKKTDKPFKKMCNIFTNANIIRISHKQKVMDDDYFKNLSFDYVEPVNYNLKKGKHNIIIERYPELNEDEPYIFVCNHTCPEDIETVLNVIDRNAYLVLGSIESLKYNKEMYLSWLNGMIPFDILDKNQRSLLMKKVSRVLKTNSILIFPEGSHNYNPNNLINPLFDGMVNMAIESKRKIVVLSLLRDQEKNISYIDVSNPIDIEKEYGEIKKKEPSQIEKYYIKNVTEIIRNKMATAVYSLMCRHTPVIDRNKYNDIEEMFRQSKINDAFRQLKWNKDVFDAEYLVKKTREEIEYEDVVNTLSNLSINNIEKSWIEKKIDLNRKNVAGRMREHLEEKKTKKL